MEIIKPGINLPFVGGMKAAGIVSLVLVVVSLGAMVARGGLNYGIDFAGGTIVEVKFNEPADIARVRAALGETDLGSIEIKHFGAEDTVLISTELSTGNLKGLEEKVRAALDPAFGADGYLIDRFEMVGPKVGADLQEKGKWAVFWSCVILLVYITVRFELKFALGGLVALIHDIIIALGIFTLLGRTFTLPVLAAVLTIAGYSINDSIVVFDRIRENIKRGSGGTLREIINLSINETLSRTILTSLTVVIVLLALIIYGGEIIKDFSLILLVGVIVGTYSSVFIASPAVLLWEGRGIKLRK
jgi:preprotein translocase subunit SecF